MRTILGWLVAITLVSTTGSVHAEAPGGAAVAGIPGGNVLDLAWDPDQASVVYAAVSGSGVFRSADDGASWTQIFLPTIANHTTGPILPAAGSDVVLVADQLAGVGFTIARSVDGTTFEGVLARSEGRATALAAGTADGEFYAGLTTDFDNVVGLWKSVDAGQTWTRLGAVGPPGFDVKAILELPSGRLVVGTGDVGGSGGFNPVGRLYYSDDDGSSWTEVAGATDRVTGLAFDGTDHIVASSTNNLSTFVSTSSDGQTWNLKAQTYTNPGTGSYDFATTALRYHAASDTFYLLTVEDRVHRSASGPTYAWPGAPAADLTANAADPARRLNLSRHRCFAVKPGDAQVVLTGENGADGVLRTLDGGTTWEIANAGLTAQEISLALKAPSNGYRYASNSIGFVYVSLGEVSTWTKIYRANEPLEHPQAIAFDLADPRRLFVSFGNPNSPDQPTTRLLVNEDVSATGEDVDFDHPGWVTATLPTSPPQLTAALLVSGQTVFAGLTPRNNATIGNYLHRSDDGGATWSPVSLAVAGVRSLAWGGDTNVIWAGSGDYETGFGTYAPHANGVFKSTDGGATWNDMTSGTELASQSARTIVVDPGNPMRVWIHADPLRQPNELHDNDVWETTDGGATWSRITPEVEGLGRSGGLALTYVSASDLLALAAGNGVLLQTPGSASTSWGKGPDFYGDIRVLYDGSLGAGTQAGLYEIANPMIEPTPDGGVAPDAGGAGGNNDSGGCGCRIGARSDAPASALVTLGIALAVGALITRTRRLRGRSGSGESPAAPSFTPRRET